jgi:hypothetical protein
MSALRAGGAAVSDRPTPETDELVLQREGFGATNYEWICHSRRLERERDEARNKMADALQEVDVRTLDFERMKQERDEARRQCLKWLEEWHLTDRARCDMKSERDEARSQRNALAASLEYIASAGLTAQHYEDEAKKMLALAFEKEGGV